MTGTHTHVHMYHVYNVVYRAQVKTTIHDVCLVSVEMSF